MIGDVLRLHVIPQRLTSLFPVVARFAISAKGGLDATGKLFIDENLACPNAMCGLVSGVNVGCEDTSNKPIIGAVGNLDGVCL